MRYSTINGVYDINYYNSYDSVNGVSGYEIRLDDRLLDTVHVLDIFFEDEILELPDNKTELMQVVFERYLRDIK